MLLSPALARRKLSLGRPGKKTPHNQRGGTRDGLDRENLREGRCSYNRVYGKRGVIDVYT